MFVIIDNKNNDGYTCLNYQQNTTTYLYFNEK